MVGGEDGKPGSNNSAKKPTATRTTSITSSGTPKSRTSASTGPPRPQVKTSLSAQEQQEQRKRIERLKAARLGSQPPPTKVQKTSPPIPQRKRSAPSTTGSAAASAATRRASANTYVAEQQPPKAPSKKLNFREIMKQAEQVDSEKLKVTVRVRNQDPSKAAQQNRSTKTPDLRGRASGTRQDDKPISRKPNGFPSGTPISSSSRSGGGNPGPISSASRMKPVNTVKDPRKSSQSPSSGMTSASRKSSSISQPSTSRNRVPHKSGDRQQSQPTRPAPVSRSPAPLAQPMQKLVEKRKKRADVVHSNSYYDNDDDESLDDFIVDDEDDEDDYHSARRGSNVGGGRDGNGRGGGRGGGGGGGRYEEEQGYDRDEIWQMFNRGKRRSDFVDVEDDLSDMEATGAELFREEQRSLRVAREEDEAEARELKRLAREKQLRKSGR